MYDNDVVFDTSRRDEIIFPTDCSYFHKVTFHLEAAGNQSWC